jgi:flagellar protein FliO/FliZ
LGIGLLSQIPIISAQEEQVNEGQVLQEQFASEDPLRAAEAAFIFDDSITDTTPVAGPSMWIIIRMILVLALVAVAIYGIVFLFKRAAKQTPDNDPFLKVLANTHLGLNRYVQIVSVGNKAWLVGTSEGGVNLISEIEDKEIIDAMLLEDSRKSALAATGRFPDFSSLLRRWGMKVQNQTKIPTAEDIRKRRERLKGL